MTTNTEYIQNDSPVTLGTIDTHIFPFIPNEYFNQIMILGILKIYTWRPRFQIFEVLYRFFTTKYRVSCGYIQTYIF